MPETTFARLPPSDAYWGQKCQELEAMLSTERRNVERLLRERDAARAGLADAELLTRGLVSRLRDVVSRIGPARQAEDIRAALEEVLRGADCRDLPRDTALDEARQGRDVLARELSRVQGDAADLARQRDEARRQVADWQRQRDEALADLREARLTTHAALAVLRRLREAAGRLLHYYRAGAHKAPARSAWDWDNRGAWEAVCQELIAADALLAAAPAPGKETDRDVPGV